jgi:hypothetical protein
MSRASSMSSCGRVVNGDAGMSHAWLDTPCLQSSLLCAYTVLTVCTCYLLPLGLSGVWPQSSSVRCARGRGDHVKACASRFHSSPCVSALWSCFQLVLLYTQSLRAHMQSDHGCAHTASYSTCHACCSPASIRLVPQFESFGLRLVSGPFPSHPHAALFL